MGWQVFEQAPPHDVGSMPEPPPAWYWRHVAANGRINAVGGEGFTRERDAERAIHDFLLELGCDSDRVVIERSGD